MCGIFGYIASTPDDRLNLERLNAIARVTERRGKHAFGFSWIDSAGHLRMFKQAGAISDSLAMLKMAADARFLIGHTRYATEGDPADNCNNHPHPVDGGWLVHNGMIHNYRKLLQVEKLSPTSACDSEVIGLLIEQSRGAYVDRTIEALNVLSRSPFAMLGLWKPGRMIIARRGNPVHLGVTKTGIYIGSLSDCLPGNVKRVGDNSILEARHVSGKLDVQKHELPIDLHIDRAAA